MFSRASGRTSKCSTTESAARSILFSYTLATMFGQREQPGSHPSVVRSSVGSRPAPLTWPGWWSRSTTSTSGSAAIICTSTGSLRHRRIVVAVSIRLDFHGRHSICRGRRRPARTPGEPNMRTIAPPYLLNPFVLKRQLRKFHVRSENNDPHWRRRLHRRKFRSTRSPDGRGDRQSRQLTYAGKSPNLDRLPGTRGTRSCGDICDRERVRLLAGHRSRAIGTSRREPSTARSMRPAMLSKST